MWYATDPSEVGETIAMTQAPSLLRRLTLAFGPAVPASHPREALRAGFGALLGLGLAGLTLLSPATDLGLGLFLVAPFGASAVLLFAVPNSPLAQPWSAIVGNTVSALVGVAVCLGVANPTGRIALAVGLAVVAMTLVRAPHPPGGAVAMTAAMSPDTIHALGFRFALAPIAIGTLALVLCAIAYARATGRRYPFRHVADPGPAGTADPPPAERLGLGEAELSAILEHYRQSLNLGAEDLARLIGAAETRAAEIRGGPMTADEIMSRDLVTVGPEASLAEVAGIFARHGFTSLPVVGAKRRFLGVIFQIHLIRRAAQSGTRWPARSPRPSKAARAADLMTANGPVATPATPVGALPAMLAEGECDAVPVLVEGRITGIVTRTDLIAALARASLRGRAEAAPA